MSWRAIAAVQWRPPGAVVERSWARIDSSTSASRRTRSGADASCTAVELSNCGNFGLLGYSSGHLDMWNLQSGLFRGSFKVREHSLLLALYPMMERLSGLRSRERRRW